MRCRECLGSEWEIVMRFVRLEEGQIVHLYQCRSCKRIVVVNEDVFESQKKV